MEITTNTKTKKVQEFTYQSFIDYARSRKKSKRAISWDLSSSSATSKYRTEFTGTKSIKEAFELAEKGWDSGIEQLDLEDGLLVGGNGMEVSENVYGSMVNIGNYIQGLPNNMYEFTEKREYNLEPLTIYTALTYSAGVKLEDAMRFAKSIINLVNTYQSKNNIRIVGIFYCEINKIDFMQKITIKDFNERFVINNIAFAFHPSFFRRLFFSVMEGEEFADSGYGRPHQQNKYLQEIKKFENDKAILTPTLNDLSNGEFTESQTTKINY